MLIPDKFAEASVTELVEAAALGHVGLDRRWLDVILAHGDAAIPELVSFGLQDRPEDAVNLDEALLLLFRHFRSPAALPFFVEYTRRNADVPDEFVPAIREMGPAALEELLKVHVELEEDQAGDIAFCLAALRIPDERVLQILVDLLEYDLTEGAIALGLYGDESARPALERVMEQEEDAHLKGLLHDAIGQLGRGPDEAEAFDINSYFDDRVLPPTEALGEADLLDMLECSDAEYRFAAAAGFIQSEPGDEAVDKLLEHAKGDAEPTVRAKCWEALAEFAEDDEIYDAMLECLQNESAPMVERAGALIGLGQMAGEEPIRDFAEAFYEEDETRAAAMAAMWNSLDKSFSAFFPGHLDDPDPDIRKQAISGVGYLGIVDAAEKLRPMFEDEEYRPNALFSYALCARTEVSPARMRSLLRRIDEFAGGLDEDEEHLVELALDERLMLNGNKPVFHPEGGAEPVQAHEHETPPAPAPKVGRNDPCPCGSGKKYKKCHGG